MQNKLISAFTLAAVLITLTIIGVIAAITIPNLMQSWRKHERITQIRTAYSIIQNATRMAIAENGNPDGWDFNTSASYASRYFIPYVKTQKLCGTNTYSPALAKGCFNGLGNGGWTRYDGTVENPSGGGYGSNYYYNFILSNNMHVGIWTNHSLTQHVTFVVDVNGNQKPNILGNDIHSFSFNSNSGKMDNTRWLTSGLQTYKNKNWNGYCAPYYIQHNGWKFPDDYPVKKF